eukprot:542250-Hanusia_phi.AAC.5
MELRREQEASADIKKVLACPACAAHAVNRLPAEYQSKSKLKRSCKRTMNVRAPRNALGETMGRIHMQKQNFDEFQVRVAAVAWMLDLTGGPPQTRKVKALKRGRDKVVEADRVREEAKRAKRVDNSEDE